NAVDIRIDVAALGSDRGRDRNGGGVRSTAPQRGDAAGLLVHALETGEHGDLLALLETLDEFGTIDVEDARGSMCVRGQDWQLPSLPGAGMAAKPLQTDRE